MRFFGPNHYELSSHVKVLWNGWNGKSAYYLRVVADDVLVLLIDRATLLLGEAPKHINALHLAVLVHRHRAILHEAVQRRREGLVFGAVHGVLHVPALLLGHGQLRGAKRSRVRIMNDEKKTNPSINGARMVNPNVYILPPGCQP